MLCWFHLLGLSSTTSFDAQDVNNCKAKLFLGFLIHVQCKIVSSVVHPLFRLCLRPSPHLLFPYLKKSHKEHLLQSPIWPLEAGFKSIKNVSSKPAKSLSDVLGCWSLSQLWEKVGYTLDRFPVCCKTAQLYCTHKLTPRDKVNQLTQGACF